MQPLLLAAMAVVLIVNLIVIRFLVPPAFSSNKGYSPPVFKSNVSVPIVDGMIPFSAQTAVRRSTYNPIAGNYLQIPACSDPQRGGFTYSFWMKVKLTTNSVTASDNGLPIPIILRGNEKTVTYGDKPYVTISQGPKISLRIENRDIVAVVNANTVHNPDFEYRFQSSELRKLTAVDWVMVTFVFKENRMKIGTTQTSSGFQIDMYLNHRVIDSVDVTNDALIPNPGDIIVLPNVQVSSSRHSHDLMRMLDGYLADVRYHNYAMSGTDIDRLYASGFNRAPFRPIKHDDTMRRAREYSVVSLENEVRMLNG